MRSTSFKQKLLLFLLGVGATALVVEIILRICGFFLLTAQDYRNNSLLKTKQNIRILCIGESTTYLGGKDSYPAQLEHILNNAGLGKEFKVINKGLPGTSSSYIADNLASWIDTFNPNFVVSMVGINDPSDISPLRSGGRLSFYKELLGNLRIVKLAEWLKESFSNRYCQPTRTEFRKKNNNVSEDNAEELKALKHQYRSEVVKLLPSKTFKLYTLSCQYRKTKKYDKAESILRNIVSQDIDDKWSRLIYRNLSECLLAQNKLDKFAEIVKNNLKPDDAWVIAKLTTLCKNKESAPVMIKAIEEAIDENPRRVKYRETLGGCYQNSGDVAKANEQFSKAETLLTRNASRFTLTNYLRILDIIKAKNIIPIFVQYPLRNINALKIIFKDKMDTYNITFVDNKASFKKALKENKYEDLFKDRFAGDFGHCTPKGNSIIAHNIASAIIPRLK